MTPRNPAHKTIPDAAQRKSFVCLWDDADHQRKTRQKPRQKAYRV